jgi:GT2 family glycosyltransferase
LVRNRISGEVIDGPSSGSYRLRRNIIDSPLVSIIIPNKDMVNVLKTCVDSVLNKTDYSNFEIIIVDNQSTDQGTFEYYKALETNPRITILYYNEAFNYSAINNLAALKAKGDHLLFLNNDTEVISGEWLSSLLEHSQRKEVGAVGAKLLYSNQSLQHCGIIIGLGGIAGHPFSRQIGGQQAENRPSLICNYSAVTGACMMIRKAVFDEVNGFETQLAIAYNDIDLCLRIRKHGYLIVYTPFAQLYHYESLTRGYEDTAEKMKRFQKEVAFMRKRWGPLVDRGDIYYNPNLSVEKTDFSIKR